MTRQGRIRQYFQPPCKPADESDTAEETEEEPEVLSIHDTTIQNNTNQNTQIFTPKPLQSRGGDKIDLNATNTFHLLTNNVNGFNTFSEGNEFLDKLTILKEL